MKINDCIAKIDFNGTQYFFLADIIEGTFGIGEGEEYADRNRGVYLPMWIEIDKLSSLDVRPRELVLKLQSIT